MNYVEIDSNIQHGKFLPEFDNEIIKNEPMFFNADYNYCMEHGGAITKAFFDALPSVLKEEPIVFDSRVHMLMRGWYPCIPGYHHDDVPRDEKTGQPNYLNPPYRSNHALALVGGDICPTEFALGKSNFILPEGGGYL